MGDRFFKVGLTGGIGTGKTTVARMFKELGAYVIDADVVVQRLLKKGTRHYHRVVEIFGEKILDGRGRILRRRLAREVFGHPRRLARLSRILHPEVLRRLTEKLRRERSPLRLAVVPLLYEVGLEDWFDYVIVVAADRSVVFSRVGAERKMSREEIEQRQEAQLPLKGKMRRADFVIDNDGSLSRTRKQVEDIFNKLIAEIKN